MDNQAFHSSRDSNLSAEASPHKSSVEESLEPQLREMLDSPRLSQVDQQLNEIIDVQRRPPNSKDQNGNLNTISATVSGVPLIDALQICGSNQTLSPIVPLRKKINNGSVERREELIVSNDMATEPLDISGDIHHDSFSNISPPILPPSLGADYQKAQFLRSPSIKMVSRPVQVWPPPPYRLRVLPRPLNGSLSLCSALGFLGRWSFSQVGLGCLLLCWAIAGAVAFHYTEGPVEEKASQEMANKQKFLVDSLIGELMRSPPNENKWRSTIEQYMSQHELALSSSGSGAGGAQGHSGAQGRVWSLPGCTLFAVSLITTLGFGAPVPRTSEGRAVAVIFAGVGIPLHLLLVLNIGMVIAVKLQTFANRKRKTDGESGDESSEDVSKNEDRFIEIAASNGIIPNKHRRSGSEPIGRQAISNITREVNFMKADTNEAKYFHISDIEDRNSAEFLPNKKKESRYDICHFKSLEKLNKDDRKIYKDIGSQPNTIPAWLKWLPFMGIGIYYTFGVLLFGFARYQPFLESLMFPLDFTVAGGVAHTSGYIRVLYAIYLEGAVVLAASTVSILQCSATQGFTDVGLKYGLLTNSR